MVAVGSVRIVVHQMSDCSTPPTGVHRFVVVVHEGMLLQNVSNMLPEGSGALAVDNSDLRKAFFVTRP